MPSVPSVQSEVAVPQDRPVVRALALPLSITASAGLFAFVVPFWTNVRGVAGPTLADAEQPILAAVVALAAFLVSTMVALLVARAVNAVVGTFVLGCGVGMLAMRTGAAQEFAFAGSRVGPMAAETAVWAALIALASFALYRFGGRLSDFPETGEASIDDALGSEARRSWISVLLALGFAWLACATNSKGQAIAAVILGGFFAAFLARMLAPRTQPVFLAAVVVLGFALVQAYIAFALRGDLAVGIVDGSFPRLLRVMPVDAAAGALCGTALGFGFARSFAVPAAE
ncbi:MAG: hypothetical protein QM516_09380 [Limnohabitans sp.]|jgi:hypothetical protein|nr:hypothetical protein [Limnohabitans sp.]